MLYGCMQSPFGYPFAVLGFWKMGFPETFGAFRRAFRVGKLNFDSLAAFLNGCGTLVHHSTGAFLIVACSTHLMPLDRRVLAMSLPLVAQHIVVLTRYVSLPVYALCEVSIEIWWEWEIFSNLDALSTQNGYDVTTRGIALTMLVAHWMYWSAAFCGIPKMLGCVHGNFEASVLAVAMADDNQMDFEEFLNVLNKQNISLTQEQARAVFDDSDADKSGTIEKAELKQLVRCLRVLKPTLNEEKEDIFEVSAQPKPNNEVIGGSRSPVFQGGQAHLEDGQAHG